jgi:hypothetical protein
MLVLEAVKLVLEYARNISAAASSECYSQDQGSCRRQVEDRPAGPINEAYFSLKSGDKEHCTQIGR